LWHALPRGEHVARFRLPLLRSVRRFAGGLTATALVSLALTQMDKVVLSRMLSLEAFGYYSLAAVAAGGLHYLIGPVFTAIFPRLSQLVVLGDEHELSRFYHVACQIASVAVLPAAAVLVFFSRDVALAWTHSATTAALTYQIIAILAAGTAMNGLMHVPYALQLANGWTSLTFMSNLIATIVLVPAMIVLASRFGGVGAASVWLVLNLGYVLITARLMHRRLLRGELARWYFGDIGIALIAAVGTAGALRLVLPRSDSPWQATVIVGFVATVVLAVTAAATPVSGKWLSRNAQHLAGVLLRRQAA
jgi:O-antigen/teichoic acid export membrane protein